MNLNYKLLGNWSGIVRVFTKRADSFDALNHLRVILRYFRCPMIFFLPSRLVANSKIKVVHRKMTALSVHFSSKLPEVVHFEVDELAEEAFEDVPLPEERPEYKRRPSRLNLD